MKSYEENYQCYRCGTPIADTDNDYLDQDYENVCADCYRDFVEPFEVWDEETGEFVGYAAGVFA